MWSGVMAVVWLGLLLVVLLVSCVLCRLCSVGVFLPFFVQFGGNFGVGP